MILSSDQGAVVTVNGGETWSSWYNQPTAQFYHVSTDNSFPYRVCGGQQESGSACVRSRGDDGQITFRDWHPVGVEEYGYVARRPARPRRRLRRQGEPVRPAHRPGAERVAAARCAARATGSSGRSRFSSRRSTRRSSTSPSNTLWKTTDGGQHWEAISPDLTRKDWPVPANVGKYRDTPAAAASQRGVIYTVAPSPLDAGLIWAGTDDGLVHVTRDGGKSWQDVTPPALVPWAKVSLLEASHFDRDTAWAAVNTFRLDDTRPHVYRTRDGGKTWAHVTAGIPEDEGIVNAVREDPKRQGPAVRGNGAAGLGLVRRGRPLAVPAAEHAGDVGARPRGEGRRPRGGDARAGVLDPRQRHAAAAGGAGRPRGRGAPVRSGERRCAFAGTRTPTRPCRRTSPRRRTRRTARRSTTT